MQIYQILNTVNNKCYIGKTYKCFKYRYGKCWATATTNVALKRAAAKYGIDNFKVVILFNMYSNDHSLLQELEKYYIAKYRSNLQEFGYNMTSGGDGSVQFNEESRKKLSQSKKGKKPAHLHTPAMVAKRIAACRAACLGKKMPEEQVKKMSEKKKFVFTFEKNGNKTSFLGLSSAARAYGISLRTLGRCMNDKSASNNKKDRVVFISKHKQQFPENEGNT